MIRQTVIRLAAAGLALLIPLAADAQDSKQQDSKQQDWKQQVKELRVGLLGGENTSSRLARDDGFQHLLQEKLGIPVKLYPAADYAGVMQAMGAGQVDLSEFSPSD